MLPDDQTSASGPVHTLEAFATSATTSPSTVVMASPASPPLPTPAPSSSYVTDSAVDHRRVCAVDMQPFRPGEELLRLPCMHAFHKRCIADYLRTETTPRCPIDGTIVPRDDIPHLPVWRIAPHTHRSLAPTLSTTFNLRTASNVGVVAALQPDPSPAGASAMRARPAVQSSPVSGASNYATLNLPEESQQTDSSTFSSDALLANALRFRDAQRVWPTWPLRPGGVCVADLCALRVGDGAVQLPCGHAFHSACLLPYFRSLRSRRCPLDGDLVCNALSSVRFCTVRNIPGTSVQAAVARGGLTHPLDALHWLCGALAAAEARRPDGPSMGSLQLRERSIVIRSRIASNAIRTRANLAVGSAEEEEETESPSTPASERRAARHRAAVRRAARRRGRIVRAVEDELPVVEAYQVTVSRATRCDAHDGNVEDGTQMTTLQCGHDLCAECASRRLPQGPQLVRCPIDGVLLTREERLGEPWTAPRRDVDVNLRLSAKLGCAELAIANVERKLSQESVREVEEILRADLKERFQVLCGRTQSADEFENLETSLREIADDSSSEEESDPQDTTTAVVEAPTSIDYSSPSPGTSPTEHLATGLTSVFSNPVIPVPSADPSVRYPNSDPASGEDPNEVAFAQQVVASDSGSATRSHTMAGMDSPTSGEVASVAAQEQTAAARDEVPVQDVQRESRPQTRDQDRATSTSQGFFRGSIRSTADVNLELAHRRMQQDAWGAARRGDILTPAQQSHLERTLDADAEVWRRAIVHDPPEMQAQNESPRMQIDETSSAPTQSDPNDATQHHVHRPRHPVQAARERGLVQEATYLRVLDIEPFVSQSAPQGRPTVEGADVDPASPIVSTEGSHSSVGTSAMTGGQDSGTEDGKVCVIDLEPFRSGDVLIRLPCMHVFHKDCIVPYLKRTPQPKCPFDRAPVDRAQIDELPVWTKQ